MFASVAGGWIDLAMPSNASRLEKSGDVADSPEGKRLGPTSGSKLSTVEDLVPPFKAEFLASLDATHLHIGYGNGYVVLNLEDNPGLLRFADPNTGAEHHFENAGKIPTGQFVKVGIAVTAKSAEVYVDGKSRGQITGDYTKCSGKLSIESRFGSVVVVKSFRVQGLR